MHINDGMFECKNESHQRYDVELAYSLIKLQQFYLKQITLKWESFWLISTQYPNKAAVKWTKESE